MLTWSDSCLVSRVLWFRAVCRGTRSTGRWRSPVGCTLSQQPVLGLIRAGWETDSLGQIQAGVDTGSTGSSQIGRGAGQCALKSCRTNFSDTIETNVHKRVKCKHMKILRQYCWKGARKEGGGGQNQSGWVWTIPSMPVSGQIAKNNSWVRKRRRESYRTR